MTETATSKQTLTLPSDREIQITRWFAAPQHLLWRAQTDPTLIPLWWGPRYLTTTVDHMDFRVGGTYRFVQVAPDGGTHAFRGEYKEIAPMHRLVSTFEYEPLAGHISLETVTLEPRDGGTLLTTLARFASQADRDGMIASGMESGQSESWEQLAELTQALAAEFTYVRDFAAPRSTLWDVFSQAQHLAQWWGPKGLTMEHVELDFRPGGIYHYSMRAANGAVMWGKLVYREIVPQARIVFISSFSDAEGGTARHPAGPEWPLETRIQVDFEERGETTRLHMRSFPIHAGAAEIAAFNAAKESLNMGNSSMFDNLDAYLAAG